MNRFYRKSRNKVVVLKNCLFEINKNFENKQRRLWQNYKIQEPEFCKSNSVLENLNFLFCPSSLFTNALVYFTLNINLLLLFFFGGVLLSFPELHTMLCSGQFLLGAICVCKAEELWFSLPELLFQGQELSQMQMTVIFCYALLSFDKLKQVRVFHSICING